MLGRLGQSIFRNDIPSTVKHGEGAVWEWFGLIIRLGFVFDENG